VVLSHIPSSRNHFSALLSIGGPSLNSREIDKLFDFLDHQELNDGALKISAAVSFLSRQSLQRPNSSPSRETHLPPESREFYDGDAAAVVFRKQPHILEELIQIALSLRKKGRYCYSRLMLRSLSRLDISRTSSKISKDQMFRRWGRSKKLNSASITIPYSCF
jgi:hypothetical protein